MSLVPMKHPAEAMREYSQAKAAEVRKSAGVPDPNFSWQNEACDESGVPVASVPKKVQLPAREFYATPDGLREIKKPDFVGNVSPSVPKHACDGGTFKPADYRYDETTCAGTKKFFGVLEEMKAIHLKKGADYGTDDDIFANVRASEEIGITAWKGSWMRAKDKVKRLDAYCLKGSLANEGVEDTLLDLANYCVIALILFRENKAKNVDVDFRKLFNNTDAFSDYLKKELNEIFEDSMDSPANR